MTGKCCEGYVADASSLQERTHSEVLALPAVSCSLVKKENLGAEPQSSSTSVTFLSSILPVSETGGKMKWDSEARGILNVKYHIVENLIHIFLSYLP